MNAPESIELLKQGMAASIIGQEAMGERLLLGLLANGNLQVEGLPGFRLWCVTIGSSCLGQRA
jgi:MoxR-like ATPase